MTATPQRTRSLKRAANLASVNAIAFPKDFAKQPAAFNTLIRCVKRSEL